MKPAPPGSRLVHLSVAIGRFVEALFWGIARAAGFVVLWAVLALAGVALLYWLVRGRRR